MEIIAFTKVPKCLRCYQCEEDYNFEKQVDMFISSPKFMAENYDVVIWKCPRCKKQKSEKVDRGDGGRFWFEANKAGFTGNFS